MELAVKPSFIYLGMVFDETCGSKGSVGRNLEKGRKAMYALIRRCYQLNIWNVGLRCHLFDTLVVPVLNYGCEVWGAANMAKGGSSLTSTQTEFETLHMAFLKQILMVNKTASTPVIMYELNRHPISHSWLKAMCNFWNKVMERDGDDLVKMAAMESWNLAAKYKNCWAANFKLCLKRGGVELLQRLDTEDIMSTAMARWWSSIVPRKAPDVEMAVRSVPDEESNGFKWHTYRKWFAPFDAILPFWKVLHQKDHISCMSKFRMGASWLNIETLRYTGTPRSDRLCNCCNSQCREDELHMITCALYSDIRAGYPELFPVWLDLSSDSAVREFMNPPLNPSGFWEEFAIFLMACRERRTLHLI
jgi:hypothetical protein